MIGSDRNQVLFQMPKNIRQVGQIQGRKRIYVEDYVMTYVKQLGARTSSGHRVAVLLGQFVTTPAESSIFIWGAMEARKMPREGVIDFSEEVWTTLYEDIRKYFTNLEIVGWALTEPGLSMTVNGSLEKVHINHFAGQDKTLLLYDCVQHEEVFYRYDKNKLCRQDGYYVYYEKNEEMQNYMVEWNSGGKKKEPMLPDATVKEIRKILGERKQGRKELRKQAGAELAYICVMGVALLFIVCCVSILNRYGASPAVQETMSTLGHASQSPEPTPAPVPDPTHSPAGEPDGEPTQSPEQTPEPDSFAEPTGEPDDDVSGNGAVSQTPEPVDEEDFAQGDNEEVTYYVVKKGDTLVSISRKYYGTMKGVPKIMKANGIEDEYKLSIGQELVIPK